jgi:thioredoxin reductase
MTSHYTTVIVGAGPYGLSLAAYLLGSGKSVKVFGTPMQLWKTQMPAGMKLKSEGFASSLADPGDTYPLADYCRERGLPYADIGIPVPVETFVSYGVEFQKRFVPDLDERNVQDVTPTADGYQVTLEDGEQIRADKVVVAVGVGHFGYLPEILRSMPSDYVSHSSSHASLERFRGKDVAIVGAGSSALDLAALLSDLDANVHIVARRKSLIFHDLPERGRRRLHERLRHPRSGLGIGWRSRLCTDMPLAFRAMPERFRLSVVKSHLGPSGGWFIKDQVMSNVKTSLRTDVKAATIKGGKIELRIAPNDGREQIISADHVISATGFRPDMSRLSFLSDRTRDSIAKLDNTPVLSSRFESSLPGLFFIGPIAANTFGPLMRFACGNRFVARRVAPYIN